MSLNIIHSNEVIEVKTLCLTIYSQPGLGKTSLAFTASNPLMLDFDRGAHRAVDRKDAAIVEQWNDIAHIKPADVEEYDTIIIDTVGKALDSLTAEIVKAKPAYSYGGALSQQGWGQLSVRFGAFLKMLRSFGKDVILISHMDEKMDGDQMKERLKISGGSKDLVLTDSDVIARIIVQNRQRNLVFSPTETAFGKDPAGIGTIDLPDAASEEYPTFLADVIRSIKDGMNALTEAQIERKGEIEWFKQTLPTLETPEEISDLIGRAKRAGRDVAKMLVDRANELDFDFDPDRQVYVDPRNEEAA